MLIQINKMSTFYQFYMIVFLRHAERGDNQIPVKLSEISYDPPIIDAAQKTIDQTTTQLAQIFHKNNVTHFRILTSKFLRCLMTAQKVQQNFQRLGFEMWEEFYQLDDRISQYLRPDWFSEYPLKKLIYHSQFLQKYAKGLHFKQIKNAKKQLDFPENYVKFHQRVSQFKKQLEFPQEGIALIIVTHGFVIKELTFTMNQLPNYLHQIKYCGYAAYVKRKNQQILIRSRL